MKVLLWFAGLLMFEFLTSARAEAARAISPSASQHIVVLDNALLDKIFGRQRALQQEANQPQAESESPIAPRTTVTVPPALLPHESFSAKTSSATPGRRAMALRLAEKGRRLLRSGQYEKALLHFEKALALDGTSYQPYIYFYLARTHGYLGNYQLSYNFLEVAESWLNEEPDWATEVATLRESTFRARRRVGYAQTGHRRVR